MIDKSGKAPRTGNWLKRKVVEVAAVGATALTLFGCAPSSNAEKGPEPTQPTASAPATPGEASPSASASETEAPAESYELDLTKSDIYNNLSAEDKAAVDKALKLPVQNKNKNGEYGPADSGDFYHLDSDTRALAAYVIADASPEASKTHYLEIMKDYPSAVTPEAVDAYLQARTASFYKGDPETIKTEDGNVEMSVNTIVEAAFGKALQASKLPDSDPIKQQLLDDAYRMLAGVFYGVANDRDGQDGTMLSIHRALLERLDAVAKGDSSQVYNLNSVEDDKLPMGADRKLIKKVGNVLYYTIDPSQKTYISSEYPDGNVSYVAAEGPDVNGDIVYTWRLHSASAKGDVAYKK